MVQIQVCGYVLGISVPPHKKVRYLTTDSSKVYVLGDGFIGLEEYAAAVHFRLSEI